VWVPRFFVWPGTRDTPRVALAALEAEAFLVWPKLEVHRLFRRLGLGKAQRRLMTGPPRPAAPSSPPPAAASTADDVAAADGELERPTVTEANPDDGGPDESGPAESAPVGASRVEATSAEKRLGS
jgi:hypothetical protein